MTAERIEWSRAAELPGVELLLAQRCTERWRVFHETYTICTLLDISGGETEWTYRGKLHSAKAQQLMLMEPGEVHSMPHTIPPCDFRVLLIAPAVVESAAAEAGTRGSPHWSSGHVADPALFPSFARLHASLESPASKLERETRLVACLRLLLEHCSESRLPAFRQASRAGLLRARELVREHYSRPVTLAELAAASGLSRFHLVRAFATEFGVPPHAYQVRVQIARARVLLTAGLPVADVAAQTGFADQSHFTRHFKRIFGVTPGQYRQGVRGR